MQRAHKINIGSISETLEEDSILLEYCPSELQVADVFTKGLAPSKWDNALNLLGICTNIIFPGECADAPPCGAPSEKTSASAPKGGASAHVFKAPQTCAHKDKLVSGTDAVIKIAAGLAHICYFG